MKKKRMFACRVCGAITTTTNDRVYSSRMCFACRLESQVMPVDEVLRRSVE